MSNFRRQIKRLIKNMRQRLNKLMAGRGGSSRRTAARFKAAPVKAKAILIGGVTLVLAVLILLTSLLVRGCSNQQPVDVLAIRADESGTSFVSIEVTPSPTPKPTPTPTPEPILHRGVESDRVLELQARLMELGYMDTDVPTRLFGPATEHGVELFQRQVNFTEALGLTIDEDGWAGDQTLSLLYSDNAPRYCVKEGMSGDDVSAMQLQLVDMGYMRKTTGYYGDETKAAMKEFQSRNGLSADGLAGEKTYEMLYSPDAKESKSKAQQARTKANISKMIEVAKSKLGCRYILGNTGPNSFDCSGLVYYCLKQAGSNRRRLTAAGYSKVEDWEKISSINGLKKGDLICFYSDDFSKVGHIGIVVSSGMMIDASSSNGKVVRRSYTSSYWKSHFVCGRRPW